MRFYEITSGVRMPVSGEEQEILDKVGEEKLCKTDLNEREQEVARRMVTRGLLIRGRDTDKNIVFTANKQKLTRN
jgi:hypothetical protein